MPATRSWWKDYLFYLFVRLIVCVVQALSWDVALSFASGLGWLLYRVYRNRKLTRDNLRLAFGPLDDAEIDSIVRASYHHLITTIVECIRLPRVLHKNNIDDYVSHADPHNIERIRAWVDTGRPCLVLTGHFGNWEIVGYVAGLLGFRGGVIARRFDNPYLDRYVARFRRKTGLTLLDKKADYALILEMLARGMGMGIVGDQDAGARGQFVMFFGKPASTYKSIALFSFEYNAPILVLGAARIGTPMKYLVYLEDVILPEDYIDRPDATHAVTQRYSDALERMIRRHPEQYFWQHNRWRTPAPEKKAKEKLKKAA